MLKIMTLLKTYAFVIALWLFATCTCYRITADSSNTVSLVISSTAAPERNKTTHNEAPTPKIYQMMVSSKIANRFARTTVVSKVKNVAPKSQEATFSLVIPETAFISGFVMEIGGKNYTAYVKEKEEAKRTYDEAVLSGRSAAHVAVSARDSNRFTVCINMEAESKAAFYLKYEELLIRKDNHYELVINLHPGQPVHHLVVEVDINESQKIIDLKTPPLRTGNEIATDKSELDPKADITIVNPKHALVKFNPSTENQKQFAGLLGSKGHDGLSGQFVVQYDVERDASGGEVLVQDGYFVHFFAPPQLKPLPKHIVFVLDTSTSMYGQKIVQLREAMLKILEQLNENDTFNLVEFNSNVKVWDLFENEKSVWYPVNNSHYLGNSEHGPKLSSFTFPPAYRVNAETVSKAKDVITRLNPDESTDIYTALEVALFLVELAEPKKSAHQPMIMFLTDGDPTVRITSTDLIVTKITEYNSGPRKSALFTLSFGNDADKTFLKKIAARNSGFSRHIYEAADASLQLQNFYKEISSPLLTNVTFKYAPTITSLTKTDFPIHFGGSEIVVAGFCGTRDVIPPEIDGLGDAGWISLTPRVVHSIESTERLWAYLTVKQLLEFKETSDKKEDELKKKALELSLKYEFVTPVSSLVVVKPNATDALQPVSADKNGLEEFDMNRAHHYILAPSASNDVPSIYGPLIPKLSAATFDLSDELDFGDKTIIGHQATNIPLPPPLPTSTEVPKPDIFTSIPWIKDIVNDGYVTLNKGVFRLGLNETIDDDLLCPRTPLNETGHCALLNECKHVFSLLSSKDVLEQHFCVVRRSYAGICCPDLP